MDLENEKPQHNYWTIESLYAVSTSDDTIGRALAL